MLKNLRTNLHNSRLYNRLVFLKTLRGKIYDVRHNIDTLSEELLEDLTIESENVRYGAKYGPSDSRAVSKIFSDFQIRHEDFVFVDLGSGKGRVLFLASDYPYKKIIGVEFAAELDRIAKKNIRNYRSSRQKCKDIEAIHQDAAEFSIPDDPLVFYICNPFSPEVLSVVLENIERSLAENPRDIYIFYTAFFHRQVFDESRYFERIDESDWHILYKNRDLQSRGADG